MDLKRYFREPILEIYDAARYLDAAVSAHIDGKTDIANDLFTLANNPIIWEWTDSIWGRNSKYVTVNKQSSLHTIPKAKVRMPSAAQKADLHKRDGYHCRFCGIPVIRAENRKFLHKIYPTTIPWGKTNASQHAAFQCMWLQYDHVVPHSSGGSNDLDNLVITCAACNFGKMEYTIEELGLLDPREVAPLISLWDGLERVNQANNTIKRTE